MKNKPILFAGGLVIALMGLLLMLIHWGQKSIELREALFVDQLNIELNDMVTKLEDNYYCFDLRTEVALPKLESFYIANLPGLSSDGKDTMTLEYLNSDGREIAFKEMPLMGPTHMQMLLRFEFDNIPQFKDDSVLTDFEKWVRTSYESYLFDPNGVRLLDTAMVDSLLFQCVAKLYPEAQLNYQLRIKDSDSLIFANHPLSEIENADVRMNIFDEDALVPDIELILQVPNKKDLFAGDAWNIYLSAFLLTLISIFLIFTWYAHKCSKRTYSEPKKTLSMA